MFKFFINVKFWAPFVVVALFFLIMELLLRNGIWDKNIKPLSYLGHGVYRAKAIKAYGLDKPNWISVGNSIIDWGLDHKTLRTALKEKDIDYIRMSMGSSKFPAIQMVSDWSIENMDNLQGIIIGSSATSLGKYNMLTQYKIAWPFISSYDNQNYDYDVTNSPIEHLYQKLAFSVYFDDIKDYFINYKKHLKNYNRYTKPNKILNFNKKMNRNLCGYELANLTECIETANYLRKANKTIKNRLAEKEIKRRCPAKISKKKMAANRLSSPISDELIELYIQNWTKLFTSIAEKGLSVKFFVLPEHPLLKYTTKPIGMDQVMNQLLANISTLKNVEIYDLRELYEQHPSYEICELFNDGIHLSQTGKQIFTQEVLTSFE